MKMPWLIEETAEKNTDNKLQTETRKEMKFEFARE